MCLVATIKQTVWKWKVLGGEVAFMSSSAFYSAGFTACWSETGVFTASCFRDSSECLKASDTLTAGKHFVYLCNRTIKKAEELLKLGGEKKIFSFLHLTSGFFFELWISNVNLITVFFCILQGWSYKVIIQQIVYFNGAVTRSWINLVSNHKSPAIQRGHFERR